MSENEKPLKPVAQLLHFGRGIDRESEPAEDSITDLGQVLAGKC